MMNTIKCNQYFTGKIPISPVFLCILTFGAVSCSRTSALKKPENIIELTLEAGLIENTINVSDIVEKDVEYIPLETIPTGVIGQTQKVIFHEEKIFILDLFSAKSVYIFKRDGRFLSKISYFGRGPGEFTSPFDIAVDTYHQSIDILTKEAGGIKIIKYDFNGRFMSELLLDYYCEGFTIFDEDNYLLYRYNYSHDIPELDYHVLIVNQRTGKIKSQHIPYKYLFQHEKEPEFILENPFSKNDNEFSFMYWNSDTIYSISSLVQPMYRFKFSAYIHNQEKLISGVDEIRDVMSNKQEACCLNPVYDMPNFIYFKFVKDDILGIRGLYNKKEKRLRLFDKVDNSINGLRFFLPKGSSGNSLIFAIPAHEFKQTIDAHPALDQLDDYEKIQNISNGLNVSDNPVLVVYTFKG